MKSFNVIKLSTGTLRFKIYAHKMFYINLIEVGVERISIN